MLLGYVWAGAKPSWVVVAMTFVRQMQEDAQHRDHTRIQGSGRGGGGSLTRRKTVALIIGSVKMVFSTLK